MYASYRDIKNICLVWYKCIISLTSYWYTVVHIMNIHHLHEIRNNLTIYRLFDFLMCVNKLLLQDFSAETDNCLVLKLPYERDGWK